MSQCETEDPSSTGFGVYTNARPAWSVPERTKVLSPSVALTPEASCALIVFPSACVIIAEGIVIEGSEPPIGIGLPAALLTTTTPTAPAFWAFLTFTVKLQLPRSTSAIRPDKALAFVSDEQASMVTA